LARWWFRLAEIENGLSGIGVDDFKPGLLSGLHHGSAPLVAEESGFCDQVGLLLSE